MKVMTGSSPFGTPSRTRVLVSLRLLGDSYPRELARLLGAPLSGLQRALATLERDGLVVARSVGRTRVVSLDPRYFARRELDCFLDRLAEADRPLRDSVAAMRRRPRRTGKDR